MVGSGGGARMLDALDDDIMLSDASDARSSSNI